MNLELNQTDNKLRLPGVGGDGHQEDGRQDEQLSHGAILSSPTDRPPRQVIQLIRLTTSS